MSRASAPWLCRGAHTALDDGRQRVTADQLAERVAAVTAALRGSGVSRIASLADNSIDWLVADFAMLEAGIVHVPLPGFFTAAQTAHACRMVGVEALLADPASEDGRVGRARIEYGAEGGFGSEAVDGLDRLQLMAIADARTRPDLPPGTVKVTFTSGSSGAPKGVCLSRAGLEQVVHGVCAATRPLRLERHLCALPLAILLENVAGAMVVLAGKATLHLRPASALGWRGAAGFDPGLLDAVARETDTQSLILMPQMLRAWTAHLAQGQPAPAALRLVAVGGAAVGAQSIAAARAVGLPAYEGYGLSEGGSVQTLNLPGADRPGSAGRMLPHATALVDASGEIHVSGALAVGYVGAPLPVGTQGLATGDIGLIDADGFLWVLGRRDNLIITGLGRNVSPEWVESVLRDHPAIKDCVVLPDSAGGLRAVLWAAPATADVALQAAVDAVNHTLPDYARLASWQRARQALDAASGLATAGGKPLRDAVALACPEPSCIATL